MTNYRAYLLKMRRLENGTRPQWVYFLQAADSDARQHFPSLAALIQFLEQAEAQHEQSRSDLPHSGEQPS